MHQFWQSTKIVWNSTVSAILEVSFSFLPSILFAITLIFLDHGDKIAKMPGWAFVAFSMFSLMARDSVHAFRHREQDKSHRNAAMIISICGLGVSGILMTFSIIRSLDPSFNLTPYFDAIIYFSIAAGFVLSIVIKSILIQRDDQQSH